MRIAHVLIIGTFFAILPFPILLQAEAAECGRRPQQSDCYDGCPGGWEDCLHPCYARVTAAEEQWIQCIQGPSEAKSPSSPPPPSRSSSSSSSVKPTHTLVPKTKIYKFGDLKEGDTVTTGKGERATIILDARGSRVELGPKSTFTLLKPDNYQILKGIFAFFFEKILELGTNTPPFRVRTPLAVAAVRGTEFLTSVTKTKTVVQVLDGLVSVSNLQGTKSVDVAAGYQTIVTKTKLQTPKPFTEKQRIMR